MTSLHLGVVAGEASGDVLGAAVIEALRERCPELRVEGVGGARMTDAGLGSLFPMERLAVNGLVDPLRRLPELLRRRAGLVRHFRADAPDVFLGIDSPDFNLGLARALHASGIPTAHLVSPSVWAWRRGRLRGIARAVDQMLCLFPFETDIYREHGIPVRCVGHPLASELDAAAVDAARARRAFGLPESGPLLALLPGSRAAEVERLMPLFIETAQLLRRDLPGLALVVPAASTERMVQLQALTAGVQGLALVDGDARGAMAAADAVLVAAGTATLEAALLGRPMVVAYRMHPVSWRLLSLLVRTPYVALPNLLAGRELVPEFLQGEATPQALAAALAPQLAYGGCPPALATAYANLRTALRLDFAGGVAEALVELARGRQPG